MRPEPTRDIWVGIFVVAGLAALAYLSFNIGGASYGGPGGLRLVATFDEVANLKDRAQVVIGGVKVGQVKSILLDDDYRARVALEVDSRLRLPVDTSASVLTSGLLGDRYIGLEPGGEEDTLGDGAEIEFTQSAVVLERLIGKLVNNIGGDDKP